MPILTPRPSRVYSVMLTIAACTGFATLLAANQLNAQSEVSSDVPAATGLEAALSPTTIPLSNAFQPSTPWPTVTDISQTVLQAPHDLLAYIGVETSARQLLAEDYTLWRSHLTTATETSVLPTGLLMANGCLKPQCDLHKSLLIVNPTTQKVYAAMVSNGRVAMWPSLMSWPDASVPALKDWLADATTPSDSK